MSRTSAIRIHAYGGPEAMVFEEVDVPPPGAGEVQIRQRAVGINYLDTYHRRGVFPLPALPGALGVEAAGEVVALGEGATRFRLGERVAYAFPPVGSYTGLRNMNERWLLRVPAGVDDETAAAVTLQGLTAHMLMRRVARPEAGQTLLVHAAAGGLGSLLTQWGRRLGCRVIGVVGSAAKADLARAQGCDEVILGSEEPFVDGVRRLTGGAGVDVVFEGIGGEVFQQSIGITKPFGLVVNLGQAGAGLPTVSLADLGPARSVGIAVPGVFAYVRTHPDLQAAADEVYGLVASGALTLRIGGRFPLRDAAEAHRALESRATTGSLVLLPEA